MEPTRSRIAPLLLLACLAGCSAPRPASERLEALYDESLADEGSVEPDELAAAELRRSRRVAEVRELVADARREERPLSPEQRLFAAAVLLDGTDASDLALAERLALEAAEQGDDRGFPLAAEAIDRQCLVLGLPQRYGTQYAWSPQSGRWSLYPIDPATSDAERRAMGLPSLAEARARAAELQGR